MDKIVQFYRPAGTK